MPIRHKSMRGGLMVLPKLPFCLFFIFCTGACSGGNKFSGKSQDKPPLAAIRHEAINSDVEPAPSPHPSETPAPPTSENTDTATVVEVSNPPQPPLPTATSSAIPSPEPTSTVVTTATPEPTAIPEPTVAPSPTEGPKTPIDGRVYLRAESERGEGNWVCFENTRRVGAGHTIEVVLENFNPGTAEGYTLYARPALTHINPVNFAFSVLDGTSSARQSCAGTFCSTDPNFPFRMPIRTRPSWRFAAEALNSLRTLGPTENYTLQFPSSYPDSYGVALAISRGSNPPPPATSYSLDACKTNYDIKTSP